MKKKLVGTFTLVLSILGCLFFAVPRADQIMTLIEGKQTQANAEIVESVALQQMLYRTITLEEAAPDLLSLQAVTGVQVPNEAVVSYTADASDYLFAVKSGDQIIVRGFGGEARCGSYDPECLAQVTSSLALQEAEPTWTQGGVPVIG